MHALTRGALERLLRMVATWWKAEWNFSCTGDKVSNLIRK
jgi:hypothetical protein